MGYRLNGDCQSIFHGSSKLESDNSTFRENVGSIAVRRKYKNFNDSLLAGNMSETCTKTFAQENRFRQKGGSTMRMTPIRVQSTILLLKKERVLENRVFPKREL